MMVRGSGIKDKPRTSLFRAMISTPSLKSKIYDSDDETVITSNIKHKPNMEQAQATPPRQNSENKEHGISDTGATGNFLTPNAPVKNKNKVAKHPITINLPNGAIVRSTHTCNMDIDRLPDNVTALHIVPALQQSLASTWKLCDAGYRVEYANEGCRIYEVKELILQGGRDKTNRLWMLTIKSQTMKTRPREKHSNYKVNKQVHRAVATVYTLPYKQQQMKYMHQSFFNLPATTLIKAIVNNQLINIICMKVGTIKNYLPASPATSKGRMK